ncbi:multicopper oxidase domain-containing protein [Bradyrhizobium sp. LHD-71]|uniref:multicopper oxidase family protein n=1 Tax=Bradyrhizobium sp. LHD-71 TaxID=3072141 RepID=UPI00280DFA87|nr:multicopper oxidase domain-containing protein [Bradyrhizobium sp. LHD-71]MDQ8726090.1 multicopper oxidase domain-containing protein [Bradyrhizobium sp. LHD-71]
MPVKAQTTRARRSLRLQEATLRLRPGQPETMVWRFTPEMDANNWVFRRGETLELDLTNATGSLINLNWYGQDNSAGAVPLLAQAGIAAGQTATRAVALQKAGTRFFEARIGSEGATRPLPCGAFVVRETTPPEVDRDELLLIEDWRLTPDGTAIAPGESGTDTSTVYTINGQLDWIIAARTNQRLRLRFVNGCQRAVIAFRIADHDVRVMAIDGVPTEPFPARDGRLILAPGTRVDVMFDATRPPASRSQILLHDGTAPRPIATLSYSADAPVRDTPLPPAPALPDSGLPARIPLQGAQRVELAIGVPAPEADWVAADRISTHLAPAFRVKRGRSVVLAISNRAATPVTFHIHGHHFRLLDRLDDGWKPFWLDTLLFDAGQTQRIAFLAEHPGSWLMEAMGIEWTAPRLLRWFAVE